MLPFAYYLLKITICSAVFFGYYWFFLRNKVFHAYNRFYLLAIVVLSVSLPLFQINIFQTPAQPKTSVIKMLQVVTVGDEYMDRVIIHAPQAASFSFAQLLPFIYMLVSLVFLITLIRMLFRIRTLLETYPGRSIEHIRFINTDNEKGTPFSFFRNIFWNREIDLQTPAGGRIFRHEVAHIQEQHSLDKMFINIILTVFWSNPFFWLIRRELNMIHEFIADKRAVEDGDTAAFAAMILTSVYPRHQMSITNPFFFSPIKRRLMMLTKNQNPKMNYISRLLVLPLALVLFAAFTIKAREIKEAAKHQQDIAAKKNIINAKLPATVYGAIPATENNNPTLNSFTENPITVVIDPGHGGADLGAVNISNHAPEKDFTLLLAKRIKELNENPNVHIILSRETDVFNDVKQKANFANEQNPDLVISIHIDSSPKNLFDSLSGMTLYISKTNTENIPASRLFASSVIGVFQKNYGIPIVPAPEQREHGIWMLDAINHPAVLIEAGYINNKKDYAYINSPKGQEAFAVNILNAINDFSSSRDFVAAKTIGRQTGKDTLGYYNGKAVIDVTRITDDHGDRVLIVYTDDKSEIITAAQAKGANLLNWMSSERQNNDPNRGVNMLQQFGKDSVTMVFLFQGRRISAQSFREMMKQGYFDVSIYDAAAAYKKFNIKTKNGLMNILRRVKGPAQDSLGIYNGERIVAINLENGRVELTLQSGSKINTTMAELEKKGVKIKLPPPPPVPPTPPAPPRFAPPPPPPPAPPAQAKLFNKSLNEAKKTENVNASQSLQVNINNDNKVVAYDPSPNRGMSPGVIFIKTEKEAEFPGGKPAFQQFLQKNLDGRMPLNDNWAAGTYTVMLKFIVREDGKLSDITTENYKGSKTAAHCIAFMKKSPDWLPAVQNGHPVSSYKKQPITFVVASDDDKSSTTKADPVFTIGNLSSPRLKVDDFKKQMEMKVSDGYDFSSATLYFSGAGFPNVTVAVLTDNDLKPVKHLMDKCQPGSNVTFLNVKVKGPNGLMAIEEKSFALY